MSLPDPHRISDAPDAYAPDGSEIRLLQAIKGGSMVHCTLPPGAVSKAIKHRTVAEMWYCISGAGEVWRKLSEVESVVNFTPGISLSIPLGAHFQFRNPGDEPLVFIIATIPPWPGEDEAIRVTDYWPLDDTE